MPKIDFAFQKTERDPEIEDYFAKKIQKYERLLEKAVEIRCGVSDNKNRNYSKVSITIALPKAVIRVGVRQPDTRSAIDEAVDVLGIRLKKYRDKIQRTKRNRRISWQSIFGKKEEENE